MALASIARTLPSTPRLARDDKGQPAEAVKHAQELVASEKVALISALVSDVDLLLLDEPTAGLDPLMEVIFQRTIAEAKAEGRTVLLSSHILAQVEALADRISIVRRGRVVEAEQRAIEAERGREETARRRTAEERLRIAREATVNAARHGQATTVRVSPPASKPAEKS